MKKYFYSLLATGMLFATSCSQEELVDVPQGEGQQMTFKVELPGVQSRAIAENTGLGSGKYADRLICAMYEHGNYEAAKITRFVDDKDKDGIFEVTLPMLSKNSYDILFMAYDPDNCAFNINNNVPEENNLRALKLKTQLSANQEQYDAFVGRLLEQKINSATKKVTLSRPFAQVNVATTLDDLNAVKKLQSEVVKSDFVIKNAPNQFDIFNGSVSVSGPEVTEIQYAPAKILTKYNYSAYPSNEVVSVDDVDYYYLAMSYVLAGTEFSTHDVKFNFYLSNDKLVSDLEVFGVPVQASYRTNIVGTILTQQNNYEVKINPIFIQPDTDVLANNVNVSSINELQVAVAAATSHVPTIITLTDDIIIGSSSYSSRTSNADYITIPAGKNIILDLNGKTLSHVDASNKYAINNHGTLTITGNGTVNARGIYNGYDADGNHVTTAKLTIENGTFNAKGTNGGAAVFNYGICDINGGKFESNGGYGLNNQASGVLTIDNADVRGGLYNLGKATMDGSSIYQHILGRHAIYNWSGSVTVNGGVFDSESGNELILADGENATVVLNDGTYNKTAKSWLFGAATGKNISFIINGGIYNGYVNEPENTVDTIRPYGDPITVCGGTFNFDPTNWLAEGYKSTQNENGTWSVTAE